MSPDEGRLREQFRRWGQSLFERGYTAGSSGNFSARLSDGFLVTPTNSCLGFLEPEKLSKLDPSGRHVGGDPPTKEVPLHLSFYRARPQAGGVVHLHSTFATALSCLEATDAHDTIPPITPYVAMRVGRVPLLPYTHPGSADVAPLILHAAVEHSAVLLANHGPVVSGPAFEEAVFAAEELEETAKLVFLTQGRAVRRLPNAAVSELQARFRLR